MRSAGDGADQKGLLWVLDEEAMMPGSTEESFLRKIYQQYGSQANKKDSLMKPGQKGFMLNHFQGTNPVTYNVINWLKNCRENPVTKSVNTFLQDSQKAEISNMFTTMRAPVLGGGSTPVVAMDGSSSLRRASSMRRNLTAGSAGFKRNSICMQVKVQMDSLIETVRRTRMHFVHCLMPQHNAGLCDLRVGQGQKASPQEDIMLNVPLVRTQVRGAEILDAIRIHRLGFPEHMLFAEFTKRFGFLVPAESRPSGPVLDEKEMVEKILQHLEIEKSTYRLGLSQAFFRTGGLARIEDLRDEKVSGFVVDLQAICRGYLGRQKLVKLKVQHTAVTCIQRNVKKFMAIRDWPWWKLYTRIRPLLNVQRTEAELRSKDEELEQLKMKLEKLEKERTDYKQMADKLENKLSDLSADLAEVHGTSSQASEILEAETAERIRLEREVKDLQSRHNVLQRKHEHSEMELMQARMMVATFNDDFDTDEDDEGDSVYRQKYERVRRELEFMKKKMQQQSEEEKEQVETMRKQLERKLSESVQDAEEQKRQVVNFKRKSQKLNADLADMRLHMEGHTSRNAELEKKQRKFDSELNKVRESLREEKVQREKLQQERDECSAEKFAVEQELKNIKVEKELLTDKVHRLERDLNDLASSTGTKDEAEVLQLKRQKQELERKVSDQEEELDDQAGTIQQLEAAKLRLEMAAEKLRQQHAKELEEKDADLEQMRASTQKRLKTMESQMEEEYDEKQSILKQKKELERKVQELNEFTPSRDRDMERRLRKDLVRTRALLSDSHLMLEKQKEGGGTRHTIKQLRNQLEDSELATAAAIKARKGVEMEVADLQQQLDAMSKSKQEAEDRISQLLREKNDAQTKLEDVEEDYAELLKKYRAAVHQLSVEHTTIQEQSRQIEQLCSEKEALNEQLAQLQSTVEYLQNNTVDKQLIVRLESKIRDLENRLELETTSRQRADQQVTRLKEQADEIQTEKVRMSDAELKNQELQKRLQRQLRDVQEELADLQRKEGEASQRKHDLEVKVQSLESDYEQGQSDLRLAFKRIADLQAAMEDDMVDSDEEDDFLDDFVDESDSESDSEMGQSFLVNHRGASDRISTSSADSRHRNLSGQTSNSSFTEGR